MSAELYHLQQSNLQTKAKDLILIAKYCSVSKDIYPQSFVHELRCKKKMELNISLSVVECLLLSMRNVYIST